MAEPELGPTDEPVHHCVPGMRLVNTITGELIPVRCRSFRCPHCSPIKERALYSGMLKTVKSWGGYVRMWTFTLRRRLAETEMEHRMRLASCWREFMKLLKGRSDRPGPYGGLQYIRVTEIHEGGGWQNGFRHYHVLVDRYMHASVVIALWKRVTHNEGSAQVRGAKAHKVVVSYMVKYVVKSAQGRSLAKGEHLYSQAVGIVLILRRAGTPGEWKIVKLWLDGTCLERDLEKVPHNVLGHATLLSDPGPPTSAMLALFDTEIVVDAGNTSNDTIIEAMLA